MTSSENAQILIDDEGYLIDPVDWDESVALELAATEQLTLEEGHWRVIRFMRSFYDEHRVAADARFVIKHLANDGGQRIISSGPGLHAASWDGEQLSALS